jgi:L-aspartate oxidase
MREFDFIVLGSGIAGLSFALKAADRGRVALITKRSLTDSNTAWAQGGVACVMSDEDSFELHIKDTLDAGAGLCHEDAVRKIITEGPERIAELVKLGVQFDQRENGNGHPELDLGREGGHSKRRILHFRDTTGHEIESALVAQIASHPSIEVMENHMAVDFITTGKLGYAMENNCVGVYVLNEATGVVETLRSDVTVLATGGCGKVYLYTTNPDIATGDGVAMAWRAGAVIANMEFIQFHPTCLYHQAIKSFLISEAVRGEGAILKRSGAKCVYLDITRKPADFIKSRFPSIYETCLTAGLDITRDPIPVVPAAHYQCGGVKTDLYGEASLRGLYAIGEAACTGLHGANRLASNSLLEGVVMAHNAFEKATRRQRDPVDIDLPEWRSGSVQDVDELVVISHNWEEIRRLMWDYVGIVRTDKRLQRAATRLRNLHAEVQEFYWNFKITTDLLELRNLVTVASLVVDCALSRKESRGLHYTLDYPNRDDARFLRDTVMRRI